MGHHTQHAAMTGVSRVPDADRLVDGARREHSRFGGTPLQVFHRRFMVAERCPVRLPAPLDRTGDVDGACAVPRRQHPLVDGAPVQGVALGAMARELVEERRGTTSRRVREVLVDSIQLGSDVVDAHHTCLRPHADDLGTVGKALEVRREREKYSDSVDSAVVGEAADGNHRVTVVVGEFGGVIIVPGLTKTGNLGDDDLVSCSGLSLRPRDDVEGMRILG